MSQVDELAGRVIAAGVPGPALEPTTRRLLEHLRPGAVILFRRNVEGPRQLRALVAALHRLPSHPLVAIDHEGGRVTRLGPPFTAFPAAAEIGRAGAGAARKVGEAIGRELASVGIDVDFAPVLDVGTPDGSSILGDRAFATDAQRVAETSTAFAAGLSAAGILPCGKHFPGHGATSADSHLTQPVVTRSRRELHAIDLVPFRAAIRAGLPTLMTAHVRYLGLDSERVATLSPAIAGTLLRCELGFAGALWSDDLAMRAVSDELSLAEASVAALAAGVDGVLVCHDLEEAQRAAQAVRAAVHCGTLPGARLRQAADRIAALSARRRQRICRLALPARKHSELAERVRAMAAAGAAC